MRTGLTVILLASLAASSGVTAAARSDAALTTSDIDVATTQPERVLFIGNSHTYSNGGIEWHIGRMADSEDPPRSFFGAAQTISGATLKDHYELDSQGRIDGGDYDVVVLQGHIPRGGDPKAESFLRYARLLESAVDRYDARTVFYMSWPHIEFSKVKLRDIVRAHRTISQELEADVAPVAVAMNRARRARPDLELLDEDGIHANWAGSYLASAVIYATLFERSPLGLGYTFGVSDDDAAFLQQVAWDTVNWWRDSS
jgi:hypothetical protein